MPAGEFAAHFVQVAWLGVGGERGVEGFVGHDDDEVVVIPVHDAVADYVPEVAGPADLVVGGEDGGGQGVALHEVPGDEGPIAALDGSDGVGLGEGGDASSCAGMDAIGSYDEVCVDDVAAFLCGW